MNCPNCAHPTRPGQTRCGHCNYKLPATLAEAAPADPAALIDCWNCRHGNAPEAARCLRCNAKLDQAPARQSQGESERLAAMTAPAQATEIRLRPVQAEPAYCFPTTLNFYSVTHGK